MMNPWRLTWIWLLGCFACTTPSSQDSRIYQELLRAKVQLSSTEVFPGTLLVVRLTLPAQSQVQHVVGTFQKIHFMFFQEIDHPSSEKLFQGLLGIPYDYPPGPTHLTWQLDTGPVYEIPFQVLEPQYPSESLRVDPRRVRPRKKKDLLRIQAEQKEISAIYQRLTMKKFWQGPFHFPIVSPVTSSFGTRRVYNGELKSYHTGLDLKAAPGTPVHAAEAGEVVLAKNLFYTGNTILLDHGYGVMTLYAHLSQFLVQKGQSVNKDQRLGLSGQTGRVTGPHLHWQAVIRQVKVNPQGLTEVMF